MSVTAATEFVHLGDAMGIAVEGVDRRHPPDAALARSLRQALLDNLVPCIRGQSIGPGEFHAAIATFGTPRLRPEIPNVPGIPTVTTLSSTDRDTAGDGKRLVAGEEWHSILLSPQMAPGRHRVLGRSLHHAQGERRLSSGARRFMNRIIVADDAPF